jgi:hypothetical protein
MTASLSPPSRNVVESRARVAASISRSTADLRTSRSTIHALIERACSGCCALEPGAARSGGASSAGSCAGAGASILLVVLSPRCRAALPDPPNSVLKDVDARFAALRVVSEASEARTGRRCGSDGGARGGGAGGRVSAARCVESANAGLAGAQLAIGSGERPDSKALRSASVLAVSRAAYTHLRLDSSRKSPTNA